MKSTKNKAALLAVILISYFIVGFPDGSFTASWPGIEYDLYLGIAHAGYILVGYSVAYTLAGVILSWLNRFIKLQTVYLFGLVIMGLGFVGLAVSPNFVILLTFITIYGFGTGAMAASMNSYMAKHFTTRHNNWMHCFWGAGAAISPIIMSQMREAISWRAGYFVIVGIVGVIGLILLISIYKKMWIDEPQGQQADEETETTVNKNYLTKKWHQIIEVATFFFLGGTDYTLVFFTVMVMEARGMSTVAAGMFPAVYYVCMTAGRMFFGWLAKWIKEVPIIRIGCAIAVAGIAVLAFTNNITGIALAGFGLAPLLPTLVSDTSNRFTPRVISKLVGYELAAFGAGIAVLFFITSLVLEHVTLEALFPIGLAFVALVFICNEILARVVKTKNASRTFKKV